MVKLAERNGKKAYARRAIRPNRKRFEWVRSEKPDCARQILARNSARNTPEIADHDYKALKCMFCPKKIAKDDQFLRANQKGGNFSRAAHYECLWEQLPNPQTLRDAFERKNLGGRGKKKNKVKEFTAKTVTPRTSAKEYKMEELDLIEANVKMSRLQTQVEMLIQQNEELKRENQKLKEDTYGLNSAIKEALLIAIKK